MASTPGAMWPAAKKVGKVLPLIRLKDTKKKKTPRSPSRTKPFHRVCLILFGVAGHFVN